MSSPRFRSVHVVSYGRSGSTLLMGLLNAIDGYVVRGENHNAFDDLRRFYRALEATAARQKADPTRPWFNEIDPRACLERLRALFREALLEGRDARVFGFKEIRYAGMERDELFDLLDFLELLAPPSAIVVLTRPFEQVRRSKWWAAMDRRRVETMLGDFEESMRIYAEKAPGRCFRIDYQDLVGRTRRLEELFAFLGEPYDAAGVEDVLAVRHSY